MRYDTESASAKSSSINIEDDEDHAELDDNLVDKNSELKKDIEGEMQHDPFSIGNDLKWSKNDHEDDKKEKTSEINI